MADEATQGLESAIEDAQETTREEPSAETETSEEVERRYSDSDYEELRRKFNERDQEVSQTRELRELAQELGYTPSELAQAIREAQGADEGEDDDDELDYEDPTAKRVEQLEARLQQQEVQEAFLDVMADLEEKQGIEFPGPFVEHVWQQGLNHGRLPEDVFKEDWPAFVEAASGWAEKQRTAAAEKKSKAAKAPSGSPGSREEDLSNEDKRLDALAREIEAARHSQESQT
jgi:predicted RNase H-like nuclease (RuvC/YqgF family)